MKKKLISTMLIVALVGTMVLSGCGKKSDTEDVSNDSQKSEDTTKESNDGTEDAADAKNQEPIEITMMQELYSEAVDTSNTWFTKVNEDLNVQLDVNFVPTSGYVDKVNVMLASGDLPMVVAMNSTLKNSAGIVSAIDNDGFWALDDYIDDYPNLKEFIGADTFDNSRIKGKIYGIPRLRILARNAGLYRKDWAEALDISAPETLDDVYEMLRAFTEDDPDGNGEDDTWGLEFGYAVADWVSWNGIQTITTALGGPNGWGYIDGEMVPDFMTDEYMEMLNFFKKLYDNGYMNKDFAVLTGNKRIDVFNEGKAGMLFHVIDNAQGIEDTLTKVVDDASMGILPCITTDGNTYVNSTAGYNGIIMFNKYGKNAIQTEDDLRKVLAFYDSICTDEYQEFFAYGLEGVHYEADAEGNKILSTNAEGSTLLSIDVGDFGQLLPVLPIYETASDTDLKKDEISLSKEREQWLVSNPAFALSSDTYTEYGSELDTIIMDANVKYIMGEVDADGYQTEVQKWIERGGDKIVEEYTEQYEKYNN